MLRWLASLLVLAAASPAVAEQPLWPQYIVKVYAYKCAVAPTERWLSGVKLAGFGGYLTALHGVAGCKVQILPDLTSKAEDSAVIAVDLSHDVALVKSALPTDSGLGWDKTIAPLEELELIGFPNVAFTPSFSILHVQDKQASKAWQYTDPDMVALLQRRPIGHDRTSPALSANVVLLDGNMGPGHSGAPLINVADGNVVALGEGSLRFNTTHLATAIADVTLVDVATDQGAYDALSQVPPDGLYSLSGEDPLQETADHGITPNRDELLKFARLGAVDDLGLILNVIKDPDEHDADQPTPLMAAAEAKQLGAVRMLLARGAHRELVFGNSGPPEAAATGGDTGVVAAILGLEALPTAPPRDATITARAIGAAVVAGKAEVVSFILSQAPDAAAAQLPDGDPILNAAIRLGSTAIVDAILAQHPPMLPDRSGDYPLDLAIAADNADAVTRLLAAGADQTADHDCSPLGRAVSVGAVNVVAALITNANINSRACGDDTPLFVALHAKSPNDALIQSIVAAGAYIRNPLTNEIPADPTLGMIQQDHRYRSKLIEAIKAGLAEDAATRALKSLLSRNTYVTGDLLSAAAFALDPDLTVELLKTARPSTACEYMPGDDPITSLASGFQASDRGDAALARSKKIIDSLVAHDANLTWASCGDGFPIESAISTPQLLSYLLTKQQDPYHTGPEFALGDAAATGRIEAINILLDAGTDPCVPVRTHPRIYTYGTDEDLLAISAAIAGKQPQAFDLLFSRMDKVESCKSDVVAQNLINIAACVGADRELKLVLDQPLQPANRLPKLWVDDAYLCLIGNNNISMIKALNEKGMAIHKDFQRLRLSTNINAATLDAVCEGEGVKQNFPQACP